ncbi:Dabb family protein [bacterium M00.F.Ca.ET.228.01.1.1]|uniref:Dabb family protein n=1 Tax=Paraburkholderia phenoliruptrix TaxID=252970 RepID=UPI001091D040|nr:Dabb family protein [Paraburkholderia phenoliruptrix]TGP39751.1 Dabb family protein [bacterium M00.F.Ca.ET.228.01.1.1]TGR95592.1 Dabb family protein [bacterium M00.F.Ca.ET.191.01.1.1]TGT96580.1 Dabb family protein [bacterium M00.F.Ca.ET.155.01.1.1]MBW0450981.1 Dabb family protein [Paraburkholderia phenoliruptrix]MBW9095796.1 Dabb family protein [Paraburkholderia phenoliruptrix]
MIRHVVMWKLRGDSPAEREAARRLVKTSVEAMKGEIPGMLSIELGLDMSGVDYACDAVLVADFESQSALDGYATHPAHLRMKAALGDIRVARFQVDYEIGDTRHAHS